tara:strand:+ start:100 stop:216 length:117 start_codon:yes stop_codon:yes gene_type:complete
MVKETANCPVEPEINVLNLRAVWTEVVAYVIGSRKTHS